MNAITIFIVKYWILIILVLILILMGIIGYIADSNGFIPKKEKKAKKPVKIDNDEISKPNMDEFSNVSIENEIFNLEKDGLKENKDTYKKALVFEDRDLNFEEFESEFDRIVPEKPVISDELKKYMDEFQISPVNIDTKMNDKDIFKDIELPEIKKEDEDSDIWSF